MGGRRGVGGQGGTRLGHAEYRPDGQHPGPSAAGGSTIFGGSGNDTLRGGAGNDTFYGGPGGDLFVFADTSGSDRIVARRPVGPP